MCIFIGKNEFFIGGMIFVTSIFPVEKLLSSFFFIGKKSASGVIYEENSGMITGFTRRNKDEKDRRPGEKIISGKDSHRRNSCKTNNRAA
jgi:hypothetical protein